MERGMRWLVAGALLALAGCGAATEGIMEAPLAAESAASGRTSDAPVPVPSEGLRAPGHRRGWSHSDQRPSWLLELPREIERYPVPREWADESLAALQVR
jgi:hypothetical protein